MPKVFGTYTPPAASTSGVNTNIAGTSCVFMTGLVANGYARTTILRAHAVNVLPLAITVTIKFFDAAGTQIGTTRTYTAPATDFIDIQGTEIDLTDGGYCLMEAVTYPVIFVVTSVNWTE